MSDTSFPLPRVLFFDHSLEMGGAEHSLLDIISSIQSFDPLFVTPSHKLLAKFSSLGIRSILFPIPLRVLKRKREKLFSFSDIYNLPILVCRFIRLLKIEKPSLVYTNTQKSHLIGVIASRIARIPCIVHFRDILPQNIFIRIWLHILCLFATRIIAISKAVAKELPGTAKIKVIYNGVKIPQLSTLNSQLSTPTVGYVGQIARWKGIEYFIDSAILITKEFPDTKFVIIGGPIFGDENYLKELKQRATNLSLNGRVQFLGEKENIMSYMKELDILVHPPIAPEPFGRVIIEAGAMGKPVVATNIGAIPEIIEDKVSGILVPPKNASSIAAAVKWLITEPHSTIAMGAKAQERVDKYFNLNKMIREIEDVIKGAL
ncbi:MAG: glycosyltransferase family 4 protein [Candidatus Stahlbacteria bacterium]|nr:glycosyltransferase family 4 protein [Candidatus Stahlbacteria bacterium]